MRGAGGLIVGTADQVRDFAAPSPAIVNSPWRNSPTLDALRSGTLLLDSRTSIADIDDLVIADAVPGLEAESFGSISFTQFSQSTGANLHHRHAASTLPPRYNGIVAKDRNSGDLSVKSMSDDGTTFPFDSDSRILHGLSNRCSTFHSSILSVQLAAVIYQIRELCSELQQYSTTVWFDYRRCWQEEKRCLSDLRDARARVEGAETAMRQMQNSLHMYEEIERVRSKDDDRQERSIEDLRKFFEKERQIRLEADEAQKRMALAWAEKEERQQRMLDETKEELKYQKARLEHSELLLQQSTRDAELERTRRIESEKARKDCEQELQQLRARLEDESLRRAMVDQKLNETLQSMERESQRRDLERQKEADTIQELTKSVQQHIERREHAEYMIQVAAESLKAETDYAEAKVAEETARRVELENLLKTARERQEQTQDAFNLQLLSERAVNAEAMQCLNALKLSLTTFLQPLCTNLSSHQHESNGLGNVRQWGAEEIQQIVSCLHESFQQAKGAAKVAAERSIAREVTAILSEMEFVRNGISAEYKIQLALKQEYSALQREILNSHETVVKLQETVTKAKNEVFFARAAQLHNAHELQKSMETERKRAAESEKALSASRKLGDSCAAMNEQLKSDLERANKEVLKLSEKVCTYERELRDQELVLSKATNEATKAKKQQTDDLEKVLHQLAEKEKQLVASVERLNAAENSARLYDEETRRRTDLEAQVAQQRIQVESVISTVRDLVSKHRETLLDSDAANLESAAVLQSKLRAIGEAHDGNGKPEVGSVPSNDLRSSILELESVINKVKVRHNDQIKDFQRTLSAESAAADSLRAEIKRQEKQLWESEASARTLQILLEETKQSTISRVEAEQSRVVEAQRFVQQLESIRTELFEEKNRNAKAIEHLQLSQQTILECVEQSEYLRLEMTCVIQQAKKRFQVATEQAAKVKDSHEQQIHDAQFEVFRKDQVIKEAEEKYQSLVRSCKQKEDVANMRLETEMLLRKEFEASFSSEQEKRQMMEQELNRLTNALARLKSDAERDRILLRKSESNLIEVHEQLNAERAALQRIKLDAKEQSGSSEIQFKQLSAEFEAERAQRTKLEEALRMQTKDICELTAKAALQNAVVQKSNSLLNDAVVSLARVLESTCVDMEGVMQARIVVGSELALEQARRQAMNEQLRHQLLAQKLEAEALHSSVNSADIKLKEQLCEAERILIELDGLLLQLRPKVQVEQDLRHELEEVIKQQGNDLKRLYSQASDDEVLKKELNSKLEVALASFAEKANSEANLVEVAKQERLIAAAALASANGRLEHAWQELTGITLLISGVDSELISLCQAESRNVELQTELKLQISALQSQMLQAQAQIDSSDALLRHLKKENEIAQSEKVEVEEMVRRQGKDIEKLIEKTKEDDCMLRTTRARLDDALATISRQSLEEGDRLKEEGRERKVLEAALETAKSRLLQLEVEIEQLSRQRAADDSEAENRRRLLLLADAKIAELENELQMQSNEFKKLKSEALEETRNANDAISILRQELKHENTLRNGLEELTKKQSKDIGDYIAKTLENERLIQDLSSKLKDLTGSLDVQGSRLQSTRQRCLNLVAHFESEQNEILVLERAIELLDTEVTQLQFELQGVMHSLQISKEDIVKLQTEAIQRNSSIDMVTQQVTEQVESERARKREVEERAKNHAKQLEQRIQMADAEMLLLRQVNTQLEDSSARLHADLLEANNRCREVELALSLAQCRSSQAESETARVANEFRLCQSEAEKELCVVLDAEMRLSEVQAALDQLNRAVLEQNNTSDTLLNQIRDKLSEERGLRVQFFDLTKQHAQDIQELCCQVTMIDILIKEMSAKAEQAIILALESEAQMVRLKEAVRQSTLLRTVERARSELVRKIAEDLVCQWSAVCSEVGLERSLFCTAESRIAELQREARESRIASDDMVRQLQKQIAVEQGLRAELQDIVNRQAKEVEGLCSQAAEDTKLINEMKAKLDETAASIAHQSAIFQQKEERQRKITNAELESARTRLETAEAEVGRLRLLRSSEQLETQKMIAALQEDLIQKDVTMESMKIDSLQQNNSADTSLAHIKQQLEVERSIRTRLEELTKVQARDIEQLRTQAAEDELFTREAELKRDDAVACLTRKCKAELVKSESDSKQNSILDEIISSQQESLTLMEEQLHKLRFHVMAQDAQTEQARSAVLSAVQTIALLQEELRLKTIAVENLSSKALANSFCAPMTNLAEYEEGRIERCKAVEVASPPEFSGEIKTSSDEALVECQLSLNSGSNEDVERVNRLALDLEHLLQQPADGLNLDLAAVNTAIHSLLSQLGRRPSDPGQTAHNSKGSCGTPQATCSEELAQALLEIEAERELRRTRDILYSRMQEELAVLQCRLRGAELEVAAAEARLEEQRATYEAQLENVIHACKAEEIVGEEARRREAEALARLSASFSLSHSPSPSRGSPADGPASGRTAFGGPGQVSPGELGRRSTPVKAPPAAGRSPITAGVYVPASASPPGWARVATAGASPAGGRAAWSSTR